MMVLVTGDRKWDNLEVVYYALKELSPDTQIVHGYATGADSCADVIGRELGLTVHRCPAHWEHNSPKWIEIYGACTPECKEIVGKSAGTLRNMFMLHTYKPNLVLAFHDDLLNSKGTKHMVNASIRAKIPVQHYMKEGLVCEY